MRKSSNSVNTVLAAVIAISACVSAGRSVPASAGAPARRCAATGRAIDSALIVEQARAALAKGSDLRLSPDSVIHIHSRQSLYEGTIVRMLVSDPQSTRGGGGLVWVDGETGCAIVLLHYE